ncbi:hypothetical protein ABI_18820 [Asticcacaulis biprosthecium C19]|uniref:TPM domain-containing protein n=1 Tax=Asticcacaulis biprosthecium C19 TaxID=715226 RepID=F4QL67_9CAUL|nr:TPM domain-containing protein [Asticcacaulis biprosthecium]EGF93442.1 hypothetical protein ABI_18820 [Asticcacaulis biprosthecium C19]
MNRFASNGFRPWMMALLLLAAVPACARTSDLPAPNGTRVVDQADVLSAQAESRIDQRLAVWETESSDQIVVVTLSDLADRDIAEVGLTLGNSWGIGQSSANATRSGSTYVNNGLLLVVAPNDKLTRIEVGLGLESVVTNDEAAAIIRDAILPAFQAGDYEAGIDAGVTALLDELSRDRGDAAASQGAK